MTASAGTAAQAAGQRPLTEVLGAGIGPRMAGSPEASAAAEIIGDVLAGLGLRVEYQDFQFCGYTAEEPALEITGERWDAAPCPYSPSADVSGAIRLIGSVKYPEEEAPVFAISDDGGLELARLYTAASQAPAVPLMSIFGPTLGGPSAIIGAADGQRLLGMEGASAAVRTAGSLLPGCRDRNVLGWLPGEIDEWVVVSSHFDSVWRGPGVLDNATGVEGMVQVIEALRDGKHPRGVLACAFAAEEIGLLGSRYFVTDGRVRGYLKSIVGAVNLDAIAHGRYLEISVAPEELEGRVLALATELGIPERYDIVVRDPLPDADDFYLSEEGIPTASFVHFPYPEYHSNAERLELIDNDRLRSTVALAVKAVESQLHVPAPRLVKSEIKRKLTVK